MKSVVEVRQTAIEKGVMGTWFLHRIIAETDEEIETWENLRNRSVIEHTDRRGRKYWSYRPWIISDPPFSGRVIMVFDEYVHGEFTLMTPQAVDTIFAVHRRKEKVPSVDAGGYGCMTGQVDGNPCITFLSRDRRRVLMISCEKKNVIQDTEPIQWQTAELQLVPRI